MTVTIFTRVIPLLIYRDIQAAHDFLVEVFGFESGGVEHSTGGPAVHAEVRAGDTVIWLHRVDVTHQLDSPLAHNMTSSGLVIHVKDVDAHFARSQAAGAQIDYEPMDQPYGQREYGARDLEGHPWWFATPDPKMQLP
jgi:MerR family transcriptional regulator, thiopeptide resistance regulator